MSRTERPAADSKDDDGVRRQASPAPDADQTAIATMLDGQDPRLLDYVVSQSPIVFYIAEHKDRAQVTFMSRNVKDVTGYEPADFMSVPFFARRHIHADDIEAFDAGLRQVLIEGQSTREYRLALKGGGYRWFRDELRKTSQDSSGKTYYVGYLYEITKEKTDESERLRLSRLLNEAIESIPNGFAVLDESDHLIICNNAFAALYDATPETIIGRETAEIYRAAYKLMRSIGGRRFNSTDEFIDHMNERRHNTGPETVECELYDGRWILVTSMPTSIGGRVVVRTDITRLKRAEATLRESEALKAAIINSALDCIITINDDGTIVEFNPAAERVFGYRREDVLGREIADVIVPEHLRASHREGFRRYVMTGERRILDRRLEFEGRRSDGSLFPLELAIAEVRQDDRKLFTAYLRDITDRKTMEDELRASEQRFRRVAETHPVPVVIARMSDRTILFANEPFTNLFQAPQAMPAKAASTMFAETAEARRLFAHLQSTGEIDSREIRLCKWDGTIFWASVTAKVIHFEGAEAFVAGIVDLSDVKEAEREIARQREALHQAEKLSALGTLLAGVAHELNNPLSVVVGRAAMLEEGAVGTPHARQAEQIRNAAERCAKIVRTFLAMARQQRPNRQSIQLNGLVADALDLLDDRLKADGIEIQRRLARELPELQADADHLSQVVLNLIVNAQQALEGQAPPKRISVQTDAEINGATVRLTIADNGPGIPEEIRSRIFEPFFTTKPMGLGTGIGLSACNNIILAHGGTLSVEPSDLGGAAFIVRLPVGSEDASTDDETVPVAPSIRE